MAKNLRVVFLGGVGEIGKNMTAIEYGDNIIIVDCGSAFPTSETPGVDLIVPDFSYLVENRDKVRAILLTHGHEDHIGGLAFLLKELNNVPIYGAKLTLSLLENKLKENNVKKHKQVCIKDGSVESVGCFKVEFIKVSHSISGAMAIAINTPSGVIFHTGDYKIDYTPVDKVRTNLARIAQIGEEGVLLMLGESTNVEREGSTISESAVGATLDKQFAINMTNRIIIATFASNVHRIQQIITICEKYERKVVLSGRSMKRIAEVAQKIGELNFDPKIIVEPEQIGKYPPEKICVISTGSQGEPMSALVRMATGDDKIQIAKNDTVLISSSPIPGNEKMVYNTINNLYRQGAKVVYGSLEELHVSGHACKEEIKLMLTLVKPKYFIPIHGEYRHLKQHAELAESLGIPPENIAIADIGTTFEITKKGIQKGQSVVAGNIYVDGQEGVDNVILRDRKMLSKDGFVTVIICMSLETKALSATPDVIARGIQFTEDLIDEIKQNVVSSCENNDFKNAESRGEFKSKIRRQLSKLIFQKCKQNPMVLPIIMEI